jgi:hypothetical protein
MKGFSGAALTQLKKYAIPVLVYTSSNQDNNKKSSFCIQKYLFLLAFDSTYWSIVSTKACVKEKSRVTFPRHSSQTQI